MLDLPKDKKGNGFIKIPRYWMDMVNEYPGCNLGKMMMLAADYAFGGFEPDKTRLSTEELICWEICKRDIDYQCAHHRSFRWHYLAGNQEDRYTEEYRLWRDAVFIRDDHQCQICGQRGGELNAHHIREFAYYPELRTSIENGITLCKRCHKAVHRGEVRLPQPER